MDLHDLQASYRPFLKRYWLALAFFLVGLILMIFGIFSTILSENNKQGVIIEEAASTEASSSAVTRHIVVDVSGAVEKPGVYTISEGARIQEALIAAGGFSQNADREYISKNINLAAKISDGGKIYIPRVGESITGKTGITSTTGSVAGVVSGLININSASQSELEELPGIGPVTAKKVIDNRPYSSINDLLTKKVVGQSVFAKIKDKISIY